MDMAQGLGDADRTLEYQQFAVRFAVRSIRVSGLFLVWLGLRLLLLLDLRLFARRRRGLVNDIG